MTGPNGVPIYAMIPSDAGQTTGLHLAPAQ